MIWSQMILIVIMNDEFVIHSTKLGRVHLSLLPFSLKWQSMYGWNIPFFKEKSCINFAWNNFLFTIDWIATSLGNGQG